MSWADFDFACRSHGDLKRFLQIHGAKKVGKSMRCPFHNDSSASGSYDVKNGVELFNCFACGVKGDIFSIFKKIHGVTDKSALNKLVGDFCGVDAKDFLDKRPTYRKREIRFVKIPDSPEILKARAEAVKKYYEMMGLPNPDSCKATDAPTESPAVEKPASVENKPTQKAVELPSVECKPAESGVVKAVELPPELKDLPPELKDLPRGLTHKENVWRKKQYEPYFKNAKNHSLDVENLFITFEFAALYHCHGKNADFENRRADYEKVAEWRAARAYKFWLAEREKANEKV